MIIKEYFIYIITNSHNSVLYTGMTSNLCLRIQQHKSKFNPKSFTARYNMDKLVYFEVFESAYDAICREKQIKAGSRKKKLNLIMLINPKFKDLSNELW